MPYAKQRPVRCSGCGACSESQRQSSRTSVVLPTPASPISVTSVRLAAARRRAGRSPAAARARVSRPTKARAPPRRPRGRISVSARTSVCARTGLRLALRVDLERRPELERAAHGLGRARADDDRARLARLLEAGGDVDDVAGDERSCPRGPGPRRPRRCRRRSGARAPRRSRLSSRRCIARAACSARSAWSSCASGTPKTAMTASPANFSTVPPARPISSAIAS